MDDFDIDKFFNVLLFCIGVLKSESACILLSFIQFLDLRFCNLCMVTVFIDLIPSHMPVKLHDLLTLWSQSPMIQFQLAEKQSALVPFVLQNCQRTHYVLWFPHDPLTRALHPLPPPCSYDVIPCWPGFAAVSRCTCAGNPSSRCKNRANLFFLCTKAHCPYLGQAICNQLPPPFTSYIVSRALTSDSNTSWPSMPRFALSTNMARARKNKCLVECALYHLFDSRVESF